MELVGGGSVINRNRATISGFKSGTPYWSDKFVLLGWGVGTVQWTNSGDEVIITSLKSTTIANTPTITTNTQTKTETYRRNQPRG